MASENVEDWELPLSTPKERNCDTDEETQDESHYKENIELKNYVESMAYKLVEPVKASQRIESLSKPEKKTLAANITQFAEFIVPAERTERLKRLVKKHNTITLEQLENLIRSSKAKEKRNEDILKRNEEIYYEMLTKMDMQCRVQYLNQVLKKFANFIANLSTTVCLPQTLFYPYDRMQTSVFCKILQLIGVEPSAQAACYYNREYEYCHKLSHALLSVMIKALDLASARKEGDEDAALQSDFITDNDIKDRLMRAAKRKILNTKYKRKQF